MAKKSVSFFDFLLLIIIIYTLKYKNIKFEYRKQREYKHVTHKLFV